MALPFALLVALTVALPTPETVAATAFDGCITETGTSAVVILPAEPALRTPSGGLDTGDLIGMFTPDGACVGVGTWQGEALALAIWADDPFTPLTDGFLAGDVPTFQVYDASSGTTYASSQVEVEFESTATPEAGLAAEGLYLVASGTVLATPPEAPADVTLSNPFPNPFSDRTRLTYEVGEAGPVRIGVYDVRGREVAVLEDRSVPAGRHEVQLDGGPLSAGVYIVRLETLQQVVTRQAVIVR